MNFIATMTVVPFESGEIDPQLTRRPTNDNGRRIPNGDDSDNSDEDEEKDDEDDEDIYPAQDPVKSAFDEILQSIKSKRLKLGKSEERKKFFQKYEKYLEERVDGKKNLLHVLAYWDGPSNSSMKALVSKLTSKYPK